MNSLNASSICLTVVSENKKQEIKQKLKMKNQFDFKLINKISMKKSSKLDAINSKRKTRMLSCKFVVTQVTTGEKVMQNNICTTKVRYQSFLGMSMSRL